MKKKHFLILLFFNLLPLIFCAQQSISGHFPALAGQKVRLVGFQGFETYGIDSAIVAASGDFQLNYKKTDIGMAFLSAADDKPYFVVLANQNTQIQGDLLSVAESVKVIKGEENQVFTTYVREHTKREQALSAWVYLQKSYQSDSLFSIQKTPSKAIDSEIKRIKKEDKDYLKNIDQKSYISYFLPLRKLVSSVSTIAQYRTEEIPETLEAFRKIDYTDPRLYKSGLFKEVIDNHFWLLENMGQSTDSSFKQMNISIDYLVANLSKDEKKFNEITKHIFNLLEKHSLYQASEYLAIKVLNQNSCTINDNLANQLESYRAMKKGNIAPDIVFNGTTLQKGVNVENLNKLFDIKAEFKVVIFGASWCPACSQELGQLLSVYDKWKSKGVEVVFVSLDTDKEQFKNFASILPCISSCDFKKWESKAAIDYHVFATPTFYLLDKEQKIILRPNSIYQVDSWVDFYLVGKK